MALAFNSAQLSALGSHMVLVSDFVQSRLGPAQSLDYRLGSACMGPACGIGFRLGSASLRGGRYEEDDGRVLPQHSAQVRWAMDGLRDGWRGWMAALCNNQRTVPGVFFPVNNLGTSTLSPPCTNDIR